jgi:hypothetical protein
MLLREMFNFFKEKFDMEIFYRFYSFPETLYNSKLFKVLYPDYIIKNYDAWDCLSYATPEIVQKGHEAMKLITAD